MEEFDGQQIQEGIRKMGVEAVLEAIGASARELRELESRGATGEEVRERERVRELAVTIWREEWGDDWMHGRYAEEEEEKGEKDVLEMTM